MRHDYVNHKPYRAPNSMTRWVIIFSLVVIALFIVGLWFLSRHQGDPPSASQAAPSTYQLSDSKAQALSVNSDASQAPRSQEVFDFYTLLSDIQVQTPEVEAYKSTPKNPLKKTNILLQAGSFQDLKDANRLRAQLILLNLPNVVVQKAVSTSGSVWYRVRLGPFANRSMLNKAEDILARHNIESIRIRIAPED